MNIQQSTARPFDHIVETVAKFQQKFDAIVRFIPLANGRGVAMVDAADYALVIRYRWHIARPNNTHRYARTGACLYLHRLIAGQEGAHVDHIHGWDGLDNRRQNLRVATRSQNLANRGKTKSNTSGFKCVSMRPSGRWVAKITVDRRQMTLGTFDTREEAHTAYVEAALLYFGEFANGGE